MILIDDRDGSSKLLDLPVLEGYAQATRLDFEVDGRVVPCGDVMMSGHGPDNSTITIGVEVKSIDDLLTSISNGRLGGTQIPRMCKALNRGRPAYDRLFLLYYGQYRPGPGHALQVRRHGKWKTFRVGSRAVPWSYLEGFLISAQMLTPFKVIHVYDEHEAGCWLRTMAHWLEKPWDKHKAMSVFDRSRELSAPPDADPVEEQIAKTAASLPAIDYIRGWNIARHYDSVEEFINTDKSTLMQVRGIGPVIAKAAVTAIRRRKG